MDSRIITPPLTDDIVRRLKAGESILITGELLVFRDEVHRRLTDLIRQKKALPVDLSGAIVYYCGPTPAPPGHVVGSAGPTTSVRMDPYTPILLEAGLRGMIGKGERKTEVLEAMKRCGAVYFTVLGGGGALLSKSIRASRILTFEELGPEALRVFTVDHFPALVTCDAQGGNLFEKG